MNTLSGLAYEEWRDRFLGSLRLRETGAPAAPSERLLQAVWRHQRLFRHRLRTVDGSSLRILHPGFWNREAGPDFRGAVIQLGDDPPRSGDVEVDVHTAQWTGHRHEHNPAYEKVILQVIWEDEGSPGFRAPVLALKPFLDAPLPELESWLSSDGALAVPSVYQGRCCPCLRDVDEGMRHEILRQAARVRLQSKARELQARARQAGWEQALWEGLFRALGYKHNAWPMQRIAELIPCLGSRPEPNEDALITWQARLLGVAGFLPDDLTRKRQGIDRYLRRIWDVWWRFREELGEQILPKACWRFHGLRPANHPQRRLALAAHWLAQGNLLERLEHWFQEEVSPRRQRLNLENIMQIRADEFWSGHWTLRTEITGPVRPLLGRQRLTDLAINVLLPWFWMRAVAADSHMLRERAETLYFQWPRSEDNSVLRLARLRLLGQASASLLPRAAGQQGLLQIVHDFCERTNALCADCSFPELLRTASA